MIVQLQTLNETLAFGHKLGQLLVSARPWPTILLFGDLGAGKTTMVRGLVGGLPGCDKAEVTSPSFNLVNHYPTTPPVAHVDLYRLENLGSGSLDDELNEVLEDERTLTVVEWAERIPEADRPSCSLELHWSVQGALRLVEIRAKEKALLERIGQMIHS